MTQLPGAAPDPDASEWLDRALRGDARAAIVDDGFTERVLQRIAAVPFPSAARLIAPQRALSLARERRMRERREQRWNLAGGLLGLAIAVALVLSYSVESVVDAVAGFSAAAMSAGSGPLTLLLALVFGAASLIYVFLLNGAGSGQR